MNTPKKPKTEQCKTRGGASFVMRAVRPSVMFSFSETVQCNRFLIEYGFQHLLSKRASERTKARAHIRSPAVRDVFHCLPRTYTYTYTIVSDNVNENANSTTILSTIRKQKQCCLLSRAFRI